MVKKKKSGKSFFDNEYLKNSILPGIIVVAIIIMLGGNFSGLLFYSIGVIAGVFLQKNKSII